MFKQLKKQFKHLIDSSYFSVILVFIAILFLFILFRMKVIEQQYLINNENKILEDSNEKNRMLKAKKANKMSIRKLKKYAKDNELNEPSQKQIIIINDEK